MHYSKTEKEMSSMLLEIYCCKKKNISGNTPKVHFMTYISLQGKALHLKVQNNNNNKIKMYLSLD